MASIDASRGTQDLRCSWVPYVSTIHAHMLWMDRNAAMVGSACGQLLEDAHGVEAAQPAAADVLAAVDRRHAELGRLAQYVDGEVMVLVPLQCVWREALFGERGRRLGDHAFVVVQAEVVHVPTSLSG